ncbi:phospholipid methyltransferase [Pacificibacter maritimus]|uniref:Phospholipid methyltransferase n=1 Tax=Pacificibacter maritimus TaxID=762213 RepID=A0A3N4V374_9RHOB|nr:methyltransferase [Pacificibacter maritimus]RPE71537.1 phospholipid methyltransferase [Pacificibacter maritimus]
MILNFALGLIGCFGWLGILTHANLRPSARIWPPRRPSWICVLWSWGLTTMIYVGLFRLGLSENEARILPESLVTLGAIIAVAGSILQSWGTSALGLKATSGWPLGGSYPADGCTKGPYKYHRHPQYIGQSLSFIGLALFGGSPYAVVLAVFGCAALVFASHVEGKHLKT